MIDALFPRADRDSMRKWEVWGLLVLGFLIVYIGMVAILRQKYMLGLAASGAIVAGAVAVIGGTRLCLPLYFATGFGNEIRVPGMPVSMNQAAAAMFFISVIADMMRYRKKVRISAALLLFLLFNVYHITVTLLLRPPKAPYPIQAIFYLVPIATITFLYWRRQWLDGLLKSFLFLSIFLFIIPATLEFLLGIDITPTGIINRPIRINGLSKDAVLFAYNALWLVPLALLMYMQARRFLAKLYFGAISLGLVFVCLVTENRQTVILIAVVIFTQLLLVRYKGRSFLMGMCLLAGLVLFPFVAAKAFERFTSIGNIMTDYSLLIRRDKIIVANEVWKDHRWFGVGHDHFNYLWRQYMPTGGRIRLLDRQTTFDVRIDSGYVQILTEFGIVGLAIFILLILATLVLWIRLYRASLAVTDPWCTNTLAAVMAMLAQFLVANIISDAFIRLQTFYVFAFLFALSISVRELTRETAQPLAKEGENGEV